jgi:hypothetical protein
MPDSGILRSTYSRAMHRLEAILYPRLREFPADDRAAALRDARRMPFDVIELVGMAIGLILVTAATRYPLGPWSVFERAGIAIANFVIAIPLLLALVGPFLVRRVRRGLERELARRAAP